MKKLAVLACCLALVGAGCTRDGAANDIRVGAVYPLSGSQGPGGIDEHRGIMLAADLVNRDGGVDGRSIRVESVDTPGADAAAAAVDQLHDAGIDLVLGSYGSTISGPASAEAASNGMLFWETGAVGMLPTGADRGGLTFRVPPTGAVLGKAAIAFIADQVAPERHRDPATLRYAVSFVDDVYGRSVAAGAEQELRTRGLHDVGSFGYDFRTVDMAKLVRRIAASKPDVLFVSAYLEDAIALRRQLVAQHVKLFANIGTSSSYCMPAFGATLGEDAVGVYASDKPSASTINPDGLRPDARALLQRANDAYRRRVGRGHEPRRAGRLLGRVGVLHGRAAGGEHRSRRPTSPRPPAPIDLPRGSLPNGSGLRFGAPDTPDAGDNVAAASVIWEWVSPGEAAVIWPPAFATEPMDPSASDAW